MHSIILDNKQRECTCCHRKLKREYYLIAIKDNDSEYFDEYLLGKHCGEDLLTKASVKHPPLFNPLLSEQSDQEKSNKHSKNNLYLRMSPLNREFYNAINIVCLAWDGSPHGRMANYIQYLTSNPERTTDDWAIKEFNNDIITKDSMHRSLKEMLTYLQLIHPNFKEYSFPLMQEILRRKGVKSNLE